MENFFLNIEYLFMINQLQEPQIPASQLGLAALQQVTGQKVNTRVFAKINLRTVVQHKQVLLAIFYSERRFHAFGLETRAVILMEAHNSRKQSCRNASSGQVTKYQASPIPYLLTVSAGMPR